MLLSTACAAIPAEVQDPPEPEAGQATEGSPPPSLSEKQAEDLQYHASILENPANDRATRSEAARRLLRMNLPEAQAILEEALGSGESSLMWPVIEALDTAGEPAPGVRDAAIQALRVAPEDTLEQLSLVVARYEGAAWEQVAGLALDRELPIAQRLGPIRALASFSTRESVDRLMELADPAREEDPMIRSAALDSLRRLAPADLGDDYEQWRAWWRQARRLSREQWTLEVVRQYQERSAELETLRDDLVDRYVKLLRELYLALPLPEQLQRLPEDLDDELPSVRQFALDRVGRLLRDSVQIPPPVREKILSRLDDAVPALRARAAQLLYELDQPDLPALIARRLAEERDRAVIRAYLGHLGNRTTPEALPSILVHLNDAQLSAAAAEALWTLLRTADLPEDALATVRVAVQDALMRHSGPQIGRLAAYLADEDALPSMIAMLDGDDPASRAAIAEGLCARGRTEPLLAHADDETVYPWALRSLAEGPAELEAMQRLIELQPPPELGESWAEAVRALSSRLDPARLLEADELLASVEYADPSLRISILRQAVERPPEGLDLEQRQALLVRLGPLLIEQGRAPQAFELLDELGNGGTSPALSDIKFQAALRSGHYDAAGQIREDGQAWLDVLISLDEREEDLALALRDEIARRFAARLVDDTPFKEAFEAATASLPPPATVEEEGEPAP
ncbi:MAG: hypothetical protein SYC29_10145 [Planctomycetota bacterium]|nr:hypothetical protein [Planctomycetota bacterium]